MCLVHCECHHLTNFALLLDVSQTGNDPQFLSVLTWIGSALSLFGLAVVIITHSIIREIRVRPTSKIILRLSISLFLLLVLFLGLADNRKGRQSCITCKVSSGLIHYFLLLVFAWMLLKAITIFLMATKPMQWRSLHQSKFINCATILAIILPAIIAIVVGVTNRKNIDSETKYCLVREGYPFYLGVLAPIVLTLIFNVGVLCTVAVRLGESSLVSDGLTLKQQCKSALLMCMLLGGTWLFALFAVGDGILVLQVIFVVLTTLQGFFVFLMFVVFNERVRDSMNSYCFGRGDGCCTQSEEQQPSIPKTPSTSV